MDLKEKDKKKLIFSLLRARNIRRVFERDQFAGNIKIE